MHDVRSSAAQSLVIVPHVPKPDVARHTEHIPNVQQTVIVIYTCLTRDRFLTDRACVILCC